MCRPGHVDRIAGRPLSGTLPPFILCCVPVPPPLSMLGLSCLLLCGLLGFISFCPFFSFALPMYFILWIFMDLTRRIMCICFCQVRRGREKHVVTSFLCAPCGRDVENSLLLCYSWVRNILNILRVYLVLNYCQCVQRICISWLTLIIKNKKSYQCLYYNYLSVWCNYIEIQIWTILIH